MFNILNDLLEYETLITKTTLCYMTPNILQQKFQILSYRNYRIAQFQVHVIKSHQ